MRIARFASLSGGTDAGREPKIDQKRAPTEHMMAATFGFAPTAGKSGAAYPIDLVHLSRQTLGDRALEAELLDLFDRQAAKIGEELAGAGLRDSEASNARRADLAHKLKGSACAVGAHEVAAAAENYEYCVRAGILRADDADRLTEAVAKVRAMLKDLAG